MAGHLAEKVIFTGCLAASIDGRIHPEISDGYTQLGSQWDIHHLKTRRDEADAILIGGETFRQYPSLHRGHKSTPWIGILTTGGDGMLQAINPKAPLFTMPQDEQVPVVIFTKEPVDPEIVEGFPPQVSIVCVGNTPELLVETYRQRGASNVLCEGGGQVIGWLCQHQLLHKLWLTVTPHLLGAGGTPLVGALLVGGHNAPQCQLISETCHHLVTGHREVTERIQEWGIQYP